MPAKRQTHRPHRVAAPVYVAPRKQVGPWLYGRRWRAARVTFLTQHPLCVECAKHGRVTAATDVDHIVPHKGDTLLFWRRSNWQALCHECHARKTATEDGGFGNTSRQP